MKRLVQDSGWSLACCLEFCPKKKHLTTPGDGCAGAGFTTPIFTHFPVSWDPTRRTKSNTNRYERRSAREFESDLFTHLALKRRKDQRPTAFSQHSVISAIKIEKRDGGEEQSSGERRHGMAGSPGATDKNTWRERIENRSLSRRLR